jgi:hypothetical protein
MRTIFNQSAIPTSFPNKDTAAVAPRAIRTKQLLMSLAIALGGIFFHHDALAQAGTVLNYSLRTVMSNTGVDADARGTVNTALNRNGSGENQRLKIVLAKLDPNTAYQLRAFIGNASAPTPVAEFTTDRYGRAVVTYSKNRLGRATPRTQLLPASLDPLCDVRELEIAAGGGQPVLRALLTAPAGRQYVVSRPLQNSGFISDAAGTLRITASTRSVVFRLLASHLAPATDYVLSVNGDAIQTLTSDGAGRLKLLTLPQGFTNPLDIHTLALSDTSGNLVLSSGGIGIPCALLPTPPGPQTPVNLGSTAGFAVLAGSAVTSSSFTVINNGDVGVSPGTAIDGFPPGAINNGTTHSADTAAAQAKLDLTTAYNDAAGRTLGPVSVAGNLGGQTLTPGLYKSTSSLEISSGDLTLNAQGDANAVFIFQIASTLTTTSDRKVFLTGGAKAANVFWQVGTSATLGTISIFKGTIMADQSITLTTGANLEGRALARIGGVTLDASTITVPAP